jgi:hypothetical protein
VLLLLLLWQSKCFSVCSEFLSSRLSAGTSSFLFSVKAVGLSTCGGTVNKHTKRGVRRRSSCCG